MAPSKIETFRKGLKLKYIFICIFMTFVVSCLIGIAPISMDECKCVPNDRADRVEEKGLTADESKRYDHRLAVLVPYRDRFEELMAFVPHMSKFLDDQGIDYRVFILHQVDRYRFNRASLINAGFLEVKNDFDYIAMHDVDLLPLNSQLSYAYPEDAPFHVSSPELHPRYHYPTFIGGILLINRLQYALVNGMSNKYWGWGLEDDEFYVRLRNAGLNVTRPENISTGMHNTFKHIHDSNYRKRDMTKCYNQREVTRKRDRQTGLSDVSYTLVGSTEMKISEVPFTILDISLKCDKTITPWCDCEKTKEKKKAIETKPASGSR